MTLFGLSIVKRETLEVMITCVDAMVEHVESRGGFVNEKGNFESDGNNDTIKGNWSLFRILTKNFNSHRKELK